MTTPVTYLDIDSTIHDAAEVMRRTNVGCLPIMNGRHLSGIVTDRDLVVRCLASQLDPATTTIVQVMSTGVLTCYDDDDLPDAAAIMQRNSVRRIVVLSREDSRPVGLLALADIAATEDGKQLVSALLETIGR